MFCRSIIFGLASLRGCAGGTKSISAVFGRWGRDPFKGESHRQRAKNEQYLYNLSSCQIRQDSKISEWQRISASIIIYGESDTCSIGQTLVLHGKIKLFNRARNEGNFDQAAYYKARGTAFAVSDVDGVSAYGKANLIAEKMYQWKYHLAGVYEQALGVREGGVLSTMLLGEKNLLDAEINSFTALLGSHIFWRYRDYISQ